MHLTVLVAKVCLCYRIGEGVAQSREEAVGHSTLLVYRPPRATASHHGPPLTKAAAMRAIVRSEERMHGFAGVAYIPNGIQKNHQI